MATTDRVRWIDSMPIAHEPSEPADCNSTAAAISSYLETFDTPRRHLTEGLVANVFVAVIEDDNAAFPLGVFGTTEGIRWRARLAKSSILFGTRRIDGHDKYIWTLSYEVERHG